MGTTLCLKKVPTFKLSVTLSNRLRFDKVTESLKVGTFLRHSVVNTAKDRKGYMECNAIDKMSDKHRQTFRSPFVDNLYDPSSELVADTSTDV